MRPFLIGWAVLLVFGFIFMMGQRDLNRASQASVINSAAPKSSPYAFMHEDPWSSYNYKRLGPETFEPLTFLINEFKYYCPRVAGANANGVGPLGRKIVAFCEHNSYEIMFNPDTNKVVVVPYY